MGLLAKKVIGATLVETILATVIIVSVFSAGSLVITNVFKKTTLENFKFTLENRIEYLRYMQHNNRIELPYEEMFKSFKVDIRNYYSGGVLYLEIETTNVKSKKTSVMYYAKE